MKLGELTSPRGFGFEGIPGIRQLYFQHTPWIEAKESERIAKCVPPPLAPPLSNDGHQILQQENLKMPAYRVRCQDLIRVMAVGSKYLRIIAPKRVMLTGRALTENDQVAVRVMKVRNLLILVIFLYRKIHSCQVLVDKYRKKYLYITQKRILVWVYQFC